jgi:ABC-type phosphate transport system substrate-binding protein
MAMGVAFGCNQILDTGDYKTGLTTDASGGDGSSGGDSGADSTTSSDGCAPATDKVQFEKSCTNSACTPFDNSRVPLTDGSERALPPYTPPDGGTGTAALPDAGALPACNAVPTAGLPSGYTPVYATGSTALQSTLATVAQVLEKTTNYVFVYQGTGSCVGVNAMISGSYKMNGLAYVIDPGAADPTQSSAQIPCSLEPDGVTVDIGISDVFASTCEGSSFQNLPTGVQENFGPVQTMEFVVPKVGSAENSISAEAAYNVYGFGATSMVAPWTDATLIFQRNGSSGTQNMIAAAIGVPAAQWMGVTNGSSGAMITSLNNAAADTAKAPHAIGILASDLADNNRTTLKPLAYQDVGQSCGYFPDSTQTAEDKRNVRDGHYPIWGPSHFYNRVSANGTAVNPGTTAFIDDLAGITTLAGVDLLSFYAKDHIIPLCAMQVSRTTDGNDYAPSTPAKGCGCYYELQATGIVPPSCVTCTTGASCPASAPNCNSFGTPAVGYCEP